MNDLFRDLAPITGKAWELLEESARDVLKTTLAARRLVDVPEPRGWSTGAVLTGGTRPLEVPLCDGVDARLRVVQPMLELRVECDVSREAIEAVARGAPDIDCPELEAAARRLALAEDRLVFRGLREAAVHGLLAEDLDHAGLPVGDEPSWPHLVSTAISRLTERGVPGPYALALGPASYRELAEAPADSAGYPVLRHVERLLGGPVVLAPALDDDAVVVSVRGGDFELVLGRDVSLGYVRHDALRVRLHLTESLTFRALRPEAAIPLLSRVDPAQEGLRFSTHSPREEEAPTFDRIGRRPERQTRE